MKKREKPKILDEKRLEETAVACNKSVNCAGCYPTPGPIGPWAS